MGEAEQEEEAEWWFRKAVEQGHANAQHTLALLMIYQNGGIRGLDATRLLQAAADQGHEEAKRNLVSICCYCASPAECLKKRLKKCGRCKTAQYCSAECQRAHWKTHKHECEVARA